MEAIQKDIQEEAPGSEAPVKRGISGSTVKIIAVAAMLIDHAAATVLARQLIGRTVDFSVYYPIYEIMRAIGRLGFPIFCFLLAEGFQRTRSVGKYALRLLLFALISEIPFDLAITGSCWNPGYQNVYFTLLLGLLALWAYGFFAKCGSGEAGKKLPGAGWVLLEVTGISAMGILYLTVCANVCLFWGERDMGPVLAIVLWAGTLFGLIRRAGKKGAGCFAVCCADITALAVFMAGAELLCTDYGAMGVLTISAMYLLRKRKAAAMAAGCVVLSIMNLNELPAFLAVIPVALYNGRRGLKMKYFFYAFYPVHLFLLYLLAVLLGLGEIAVM